MLGAYYSYILSKCSSSGKYAHVLALVTVMKSWKINGYKEIPAEPSSTTLPQWWDKPRGQKVLPKPESQMIFFQTLITTNTHHHINATYFFFLI